MTQSARKLPEGILDVRKVKTVMGEGVRPHLTFVLAYNAGIETGSDRYEAIRKYADGLKAPASMDRSVMLLPVAPHPSPEPAPAPKQKPKRAKARARPAAKASKHKPQKQTKTRTKPRRSRR